MSAGWFIVGAGLALCLTACGPARQQPILPPQAVSRVRIVGSAHEPTLPPILAVAALGRYRPGADAEALMANARFRAELRSLPATAPVPAAPSQPPIVLPNGLRGARLPLYLFSGIPIRLVTVTLADETEQSWLVVHQHCTGDQIFTGSPGTAVLVMRTVAIDGGVFADGDTAHLMIVPGDERQSGRPERDWLDDDRAHQLFVGRPRPLAATLRMEPIFARARPSWRIEAADR